MAPRGSVMSMGHDHAVQVYDHDREAVEMVARFSVAGFDAGDLVLVVATPDHCAGVAAELDRLGADSVARIAAGDLQFVDAQECVDALLVGGRVSHSAFEAQVLLLLGEPGAAGRRIRGYGEMAPLLYARGAVSAAVEVESLWEDEARRRGLTILCGYRRSDLPTGTLGDLRRLSDVHTRVLAGGCDLRAALPPSSGRPSADGLDARTAVFLPAAEEVRAARRFVTEVLHGWGEGDLVDDACIVVSELAGNAVRHGASPFRASVGRSGGRLRIAVEDLDPRTPESVPTPVHALAGRGMGIVDALTRRWWSEPSPGGKVVHGELSRGLARPVQ